MKLDGEYGDYWETFNEKVGKYNEYQKKWDFRFLKLAKEPASWSKDPSRQVGAVIFDHDRTPISLGYNGFAKGVKDLPERYLDKSIKYELVVHAEVNAILKAKHDLTRATLYTLLYPCSRCAGVIINSGLKKVVTLIDDMTKFDDTAHSFHLSKLQFDEAGVQVVQYKLSEFTRWLYPSVQGTNLSVDKPCDS